MIRKEDHSSFGPPRCECGKGMYLEMGLGMYYCPMCEAEEVAKMVEKSKAFFQKVHDG